MADFQTPGSIELNPGQEEGWEFELPIAPSATAKGALPYGRIVVGIDVTAYTEDGTSVTDILITGTPSFIDNIIYVVFQYPESLGEGRYRVNILVTMDNGWTKPFDFFRVYAKEI